MEYTKHPSLALAITIGFVLFTLANGACIQKEEGGPIQCCDQREHGGSLRCCKGRNSTCGMEDFVNNVLCFCDEFCERAGDCCPDFESVKKPCGLGNRKSSIVLFFQTSYLQFVSLCYRHRAGFLRSESLSGRTSFFSYSIMRNLS